MRPGSSGGSPTRHRAFAIAVGLNTAFVVLEALFGFLGGSIALVADAGHNLSDVLGLLLAWGASRLTQVAPTERRTYGIRRSTIFAALLNAVLLLVAVGAIAWEAVRRLREPEPVAGATVIIVAVVGVAVNTATALLFMRGRKQDLNIAGAFLHMAADAAVSAGVALAGLAILLTGFAWLDPVTSLVIVIVILVGTWGLLRDSVNLALDAVPSSIDTRQVEDYLFSLPAITEVHDLHIWAMSTTEIALTAHLVKPDPAGDDDLLVQMSNELRTRFGIQHPTIQWERKPSTLPCRDPRQNDGLTRTGPA